MDFNFDIKVPSIKEILKDFSDTFKSKSFRKSFKRFSTIIASVFVWMIMFYIVFSALKITIRLEPVQNAEGQNETKVVPYSPYISELGANLVITLLPCGSLIPVIFLIMRYRKTDDKYFNDNKKIYQAKVAVTGQKKGKFFPKGQGGFVAVEVLIYEDSEKNPHALVELEFPPDEPGDIIEIEYLLETNEARLLKK